MGSEMSRKQLGRAAADGKLITFHRSEYGPVTGYLVGMDDFHWLVVSTQQEQLLVHKGLTPSLLIHPESTLQGSTIESLVNEIGSAFRSYCMREFAPPRKVQD